MSDEQQHRRWEDAQREIANAVGVAVAQAMTPWRLTLDRHDDDIRQLNYTVFGNPATRQKGLVEQLESITTKLDTIIDQRRQMTWLIRGVIAGLTVNLAVVTGLASELGKLLVHILVP